MEGNWSRAGIILFWVEMLQVQLRLDEKSTEEKLAECVHGCAKTVVTLRGMYLRLHRPTEELLTLQIEGLTPERFRDAAVRVEDYMAVVDEEYKNKLTRGRSWKGRGRKIDELTRRRLIRFSPFPQSFSNILKTMRKDLDFWRQRNCIVLEGEKHGRYKQNIYILPYASAPDLMLQISAANNTVDELNKRIVDYEQTQHYEDLRQLLRTFGVEQLLDRTWTVGSVSFQATPLALDPDAVRQIVEDETRRVFDQLDETKRQGIQMITESVERSQREFTLKAINDMKQKIEPICRRIVAASKKKPERVKADLERLRRIAVSVGLEAIASSVITPLAQVVDDPEKTLELFGTKEISGEVDKRIRGLIDSL